MKLSEELTWRGFVNQTTYTDLSAIDGDPISFYLGVDPSADSMTIGHLAVIMAIRHLIDHGHQAFMLVGGATGMVGDPEGKANERNLKTIEEINLNKQGIARQYDILFAGQPYTLVDNYDWFKDMNYLSFLREIGKNVPLSQMLSRDFVQSRMGVDGSGISYAEFSYSLIQGYDFLHLYKEYGVTLQMCGADQWGNCVTGVDLIRRITGAEANIFSIPLVINKATGMKFGKSEDGAVWLDDKKTSVYKFYQFWLNVDDAGVIDYLKIYTLLPKEEIEKLETKTQENPAAREAQKALARAVTTLVHGEDRMKSVEKVTDVLFAGADFHSLDSSDIDLLAAEIPTVNVCKSVVEVLVESGVASSNSESRRLISAGAVSVNSNKISEDFTINVPSLIKKGKNTFVLVK